MPTQNSINNIRIKTHIDIWINPYRILIDNFKFFFSIPIRIELIRLILVLN